MYHITVVSTRHEAFGKWNSDALYAVLEHLKPDLIFEEIPPSCFEQYYKSKSRRNLETFTVNKYLGSYDIENIPVDSDDIPSDKFFRDYEYLVKKVECRASQNGYNYRDFMKRNSDSIYEQGIAYLNSFRSEWIIDEIRDAVDKSLQEINDASLSRINELWKEVNDRRENEMIDNIYKYSEEHKYDRAIFTVGFAHRKSLRQKISEREKSSKLKLDWRFLGD